MAAQKKQHIVSGDRVRVIRGNYREMEGTVLRVLRDRDRVVVEGVNMRKHHEAPSQADPEGGIQTYEAPIHVSNVMLIDPTDGEPGADRRGGGRSEGSNFGQDRKPDPQAMSSPRTEWLKPRNA